MILLNKSIISITVSIMSHEDNALHINNNGKFHIHLSTCFWIKQHQDFPESWYIGFASGTGKSFSPLFPKHELGFLHIQRIV